MEKFTGIEYVKIDIANQFGLDRLRWHDRIHWVNNNQPDLPELIENSEKPLLFEKALRALEAAEQRIKYRFNVGLDATASGIQMMAAMSGCKKTAACVNLINTGKREDVYQDVADEMSDSLGIKIGRKTVKKPIMTFFYGSQAQPKAVFGEGEGLTAFYSALGNRMPGALELMKLFQSFWNPTVSHYEWAMPDGHVVYWPVMEAIDKGIEIDEAHHLRFTFRSKQPMAQIRGRSLAANLTHSVDGYVCREMIRRAQEQGFHMAPIHDCFYSHPNDMNMVRQNYIDIMAEVAEMDLVTNILSQINPARQIRFHKHSEDLSTDIREAEYALS